MKVGYASEGERQHRFGGGWIQPRADVDPVTNETYHSECGDCHFAYQPGLLPAPAWEDIMGSLESHYGEDASLDTVQAAESLGYVRENAVDHALHTIQAISLKSLERQ